MNAADESERLPPSIGGLVDLGFGTWARRAPLYLALSLGVFALCGAVEALWPARTPNANAVKLLVLIYAEVLGLAFVVAAVALGVATRVAGENVSSRTLLAGALARWPAVLGAMIVVYLVVIVTGQYGALGPLLDPPVLTLLMAPFFWLMWGIISLAGPIAALSGERPLIALLTSFTRAIGLSMHRGNFARVCVVSFATIVPTLIASVLFDVFVKRGVPHANFLANLPVDVLSVGPVAAVQTAFALDFARRAGAIDEPPA